MHRFDLHEVFVVHNYTLDPHVQEAHEHKSFELIFIEQGRGYHIINDIRLEYQDRSIFFLAPNDVHHFEIEETTTFTFFKFTELLFSNKINLPDRAYWLQRIEHILHTPNLTPRERIISKRDRDLIFDIHDVVIREFKEKNTFFQEIISNTITTILSLFARYISDSEIGQTPDEIKSDNIIDTVLTHIRKNVYESEKMKINALAREFGLSPTSLSNKFKKETGASVHQYILNYKVELAKYRLINTKFTVSEIAYQLGFSDESHITKVFNRKVGMTPRSYRLQSRG